MKRNELTHARLCELLHYDPDTGIFRWRVSNSNRVAIGQIAGNIKKNGYRYIGIDGVLYRAHRLAWFYVYGTWPDCDIDHINQIKSDNRIENLRHITRSQNLQNTGVYKNNTSGFRGVSWASREKKWIAQIKINRKNHLLGYFNSKETAYEAYLEAAQKVHTHNPHIEMGA